MSNKIKLKLASGWRSGEPEQLVYWPASHVPLDPKFVMEKNGKIIAQEEIQYESFPQDDASLNDYNYFIGYVEPNGKKMVCHPAKISRMCPNYSFKDEAETEKNEETPAKLTRREQMDELKGKFGSKKTQRDLANKRKYEIQFGEEDARDLPTIEMNQQGSPAETKNNNDEDGGGGQPLSTILPPRNDEAKSIDQVYSVNDIITEPEEQAIRHLEDQLFGLIKNDYLKQLGSKSDDHQHRMMAIYADTLLQMVKLTAGQMRRPDPLPEIIGDLKKHLFERYTLTKQLSTRQLKYVITDQNKDRIFIHIFILIFMLNNYKPIELDKLQKMCQVNSGHVRRILELIGCYIENEKSSAKSFATKMAELRLPLNTYQDVNKKRRQRR